MFRRNLPQADFHSVIVKTPLLGGPEGTEERIRNELKEKIAKALQPDDEVVYLILDTHGATQDGETVMEYLGKISAQGPDEDFRELFDPLKGQFSPNLKIVLNSCSVFADDEQQSALRAKALIDYFKAPYGAVYGSKVPEVLSAQYPLKYSMGRGMPVKIYAGLLVSAAVLFLSPSLGMHNDAWLPALVTDAELAAAFSAVGVTFQLSILKLMNVLKMVNYGYLFQFKDGKLEKTEIIRKFKNIARTYGFGRDSDGKTTSAPLCAAVHL
jgi:hypothetical protein